MITVTYADTLRQHKNRDYLFVEQTLALTRSNSFVREVKNICSNFKRIAWRCLAL